MKRLMIYIFSMANLDNMDNFLRRVNFVDDSIFTLAKRITTLLVTFKRFTAVGLRGKMVNAIY